MTIRWLNVRRLMAAMVVASFTLCGLAIYGLFYIDGLHSRLDAVEATLEEPRLSGDSLIVVDPDTGTMMISTRYIGESDEKWAIRLEDAERKMMR